MKTFRNMGYFPKIKFKKEMSVKKEILKILGSIMNLEPTMFNKSTIWTVYTSSLNDSRLFLPSTALVEKKAKLRVSSGLSLVNSAVRVCGSDSPVNDELST